jgi:hypothetical protein
VAVVALVLTQQEEMVVLEAEEQQLDQAQGLRAEQHTDLVHWAPPYRDLQEGNLVLILQEAEEAVAQVEQANPHKTLVSVPPARELVHPYRHLSQDSSALLERLLHLDILRVAVAVAASQEEAQAQVA